MKKMRYLLLSLFTMCLFLSACQGGMSSDKVDSEKAMENFLVKIEEGNYVMSGGGFMETTVSSRDQVVFDYVDEAYQDLAFMSVEGEAFKGVLKEDGVDNVVFVSEGQAIDAARNRLPNSWLDISEGNIWNLFYNIQEEPLKFVSHDENIKMSVLSFAGYNEMAMGVMHDVYLVLDKEDPETAHIQAEMDDDMVTRISYEDIDIEIAFGKAESCPQADAWVSAPVYPEARKDWTEGDQFILNSVFMTGYGLDAVPFPEFASYAFKVDDQNFVMDDKVYIRDHHASEEDMAAYADKLLKNGFTEVKETDGEGNEKTCYRKLLREAYRCYSNIELEYDDGINMVADKYYDFPVYDTFEDINAQIKAIGYPVLEESENLSSWKGTDRAIEATESWLYFFDYDLNLYVEADYEDQEETVKYLQAYIDRLTAEGFTPVYSESEDEPDHYVSENGFYTFRYVFLEEGKVTMLFRSERYITPSEAEEMISAAGFPAITLKEPISCRDLKQFRKAQYGRDEKAFLTVSQTFESPEEAEAFLDAYEEALNAEGFDRTNPDNVGSNKSIAIANEEKGMYVGFDYFPEQAMVNLDFSAE
ncbi:MAG: hypothetical protein IKF68_00425 [Erysipelotrichaceae bacterium]|nr:hypothetical protein [Erysipelotrichaceae bacterium]